MLPDKGGLTGRLLYQASGKPAQGYSVGLGTANFDSAFGTTPFRAESWVRSDDEGNFSFFNVNPGGWIVGVDDPFFDVVYPWESVTVSVGTIVIVELKIVDKDLELISPPNESVLEINRPDLVWAAYPNAVSYKAEIRHLSDVGDVHNLSGFLLPHDTAWSAAHNLSKYSQLLDEPGHTTATEIALLQDLPPGWYQWSVLAYNIDADKWAFCDCGGDERDSNYWTFGIPGDKTLIHWFKTYTYSDDQSLSIHNDTGRELVLDLVGYGSILVGSDDNTFFPDEEITDLPPGTYSYTATVSNVAPISGTIVIEPSPQTLRFYVSSSVSP